MDDRRNTFMQLGEAAARVVKRMRPIKDRPEIVEVPADDFDRMVDLARSIHAPAEPKIETPCDIHGHHMGEADKKTGIRRCLRCPYTRIEKKERTRAEG